jgi:hypothetical protein
MIEEGDYIETNARWGKRFVEIIDPTKENEILRVYFEQPNREWQGLTDDEIENLMDTYDIASTDYAKAVETKLKEKNT